MGLLFGNNTTDRVNFGNDSSIGGFTAFTMLMRVFPTSIPTSASKYLAYKSQSTATFEREFSIRNTTGQIDFLVKTSNHPAGTATARSANSAGNVLIPNRWWYVAMVLNSSLVPKIYLGGDNLPFYETSYATQTTGTGTVNSESSFNLIIGNNSTPNNPFPGIIDWVQWHNADLSLQELQHQQINPRIISSTRLFAYLGRNGTNPIRDLTQNPNIGTVTGAVPCPPYNKPPKRRILYAPLSYNSSLGGTLTPSGIVVKAVTTTKTGSVTPTGSIVKTVFRTLTGSLTSIGNIYKTISRTLSGSETPTGTVTNQTGKSLTGTLTPSGIVAKTLSKTLTGFLTPLGNIYKTVARSLTGSVTPTGVINTLRVFLLSLAGNLTPSGSLIRSISKSLTGSLSPSGSIVKTISRVLSGALSIVGNIITSVFSTTQKTDCIVTVQSATPMRISLQSATRTITALSSSTTMTTRIFTR